MKNYYFLFIALLLLSSCKIENLEDKIEIPKTDFSSYNYVMATEDASNEDISTFFSFNLGSVSSTTKYDLLNENDIFINSNPSTSSGQISMNQYVFTMARDKNGYSSTPGVFRLTLNRENRMYLNDNLSIAKNNLFPARQLCIVDETLGYFYDEGKDAHKIKIFDPTKMILKGSIDLKPAIEAFRDSITWIDGSKNNLVRTGSVVLAHKEGKLYISLLFLDQAGFNLISEDVNEFYLMVVDIHSHEVENIITYEGIKTVGFFLSENTATALNDNGDLYICSWGWNQFNEGNPSKIIRIKSGETDFDANWEINIDELFGPGRIAQSMITYKNKLYVHVSNEPYAFLDADEPDDITMSYYVFDPNNPTMPELLDIPTSNTSARMNVFSIVDDKLFISVPNINSGKFNGYYSIDANENIKKELTIENKYRPTRLYKLQP
ncbi:MAG TPA: hypothetical protein VFD77_04705 [Brumimicrobium sp.]|nr:hypothetical protein [Brumimicrobium sp.]